ncbi:MAG TPA: YfhO family protein [Puia sp.]|nr:YfhO family protein [Puia sp.]
MRFITINRFSPGKLVPHVVALLIFLLVAVIYCKPVFENKVLFQEDVLQWQGMARNSFQYKATHGHFPLWTNGMFSGMPAYQIAMDSPFIGISAIFYKIITLGLPKPVSFFFLACLCFYFLALALRINPYVGIIAALAYAYATYNPVIVAVGHDTKMQSIALLPGLIASLLLLFERKYWQGMALTALFMALLVSIGHMQIIYYGVIIAVCMFIGYAIRWIRAKDFRHLGRVAIITLGSVATGVLSNAVSLFTTYDSSKETVRGGSELADKQSNYTANGLSENSAFDFSMYRTEPFVMLVPDLFGGSTDLELPEEHSKAVGALEKMPPELASQIGEEGPKYYWGGIGVLVSGPPYAGAIICFLAMIGLFLLDNKHKWWILGACILSIVMSWGSYFQPFSSFLLKWLPMYNKFRAPSMIIVVPTFLLCMLAMLTLDKISTRVDPAALWRQYKWGLLFTGGVFAVLAVLYIRYDYTSALDKELLQKAATRGSDAFVYMQAYVNGLKSDRQSLFFTSALRSFCFIAGAALLIIGYMKTRLRPALFLGIIGVLCLVDVFGIDLKYLNNDNYKEKIDYNQNFSATQADRQVLEDKGYYRVFDIRDSAANALTYGAMTAYFHNSIGGYHAAKLRIYEDLINRQLFNYPHCSPVINMLNTKYIIGRDHSGKDSVYRNDSALGPVWFVRTVRFEQSPQAVMSALTHLHPEDTAIVFNTDRQRVSVDADPDSTAFIDLVKNDNDLVTYLSESSTKQFAVFSEVFYDRGWKAWVDNREEPIIRTNYALRGLSLPPGRHVIRFVFRPTSFYLGRQVQMMATIILLLLLAGALIVNSEEKGIRLPPFRPLKRWGLAGDGVLEP